MHCRQMQEQQRCRRKCCVVAAHGVAFDEIRGNHEDCRRHADAGRACNEEDRGRGQPQRQGASHRSLKRHRAEIRAEGEAPVVLRDCELEDGITQRLDYKQKPAAEGDLALHGGRDRRGRARKAPFVRAKKRGNARGAKGGRKVEA